VCKLHVIAGIRGCQANERLKQLGGWPKAAATAATDSVWVGRVRSARSTHPPTQAPTQHHTPAREYRERVAKHVQAPRQAHGCAASQHGFVQVGDHAREAAEHWHAGCDAGAQERLGGWVGRWQTGCECVCRGPNPLRARPHSTHTCRRKPASSLSSSSDDMPLSPRSTGPATLSAVCPPPCAGPGNRVMRTPEAVRNIDTCRVQQPGGHRVEDSQRGGRQSAHTATRHILQNRLTDLLHHDSLLLPG
jgi:hypothetical protein